MATNKKTETTEKPWFQTDEKLTTYIHRGTGGVDFEKSMKATAEILEAFIENDKAVQSAVIKAVESVLSSEKPEHVALTRFVPSTLARMAIFAMGIVPDQAVCDDAEVRAKAYLKSQPDKYLYIDSGRNAGAHVKDRLSEEDLKKLVKSA